MPVRALTGMLTDKEVSWDGNMQTVYIGNRPENGEESVAIDTMKPYSGRGFYTGKDAQFNILDKTVTPFNSSSGDSDYILDAKYSRLNRKYVIPYTSIGSKSEGSLIVYNIDQHGEKTELARYTAKAGDAPIDVSVNISGCNIIRIVWDYGRSFYDVTLTTAN